MDKTIKIKRTGKIFRTIQEALVYLNNIPHKKGQPVMLLYCIDENNVDSILALGIEDGVGPDSYKIISVSGIKVISGIITSEEELPDSSTLVNSETYVYRETITNDLYWIFLDQTHREVAPIDSNIYYRVYSLADNSEYWVFGGDIERFNNSYSKEYIDSIIYNITNSITSNAEDTINVTNNIKDLLISGAGLNSDGTYKGTIFGARTLDEADRILNTNIGALRDLVLSYNSRVSELENEFRTSSAGLTGLTRLDELYNWFEDQKYKPSWSIKFSRADSKPLIAGETVVINVKYSWSYANKAGITGLKLNGTTIKTLTTSEQESESDEYVHTVSWTIPESTSSTSKTWSASFAGVVNTPVTYSLSSVPINRSAEITWPTEEWKTMAPSTVFVHRVSFSGTGLPSSWEGNEIYVSVDGDKKFQVTESSSSTQNYTYSGNLNPNDVNIQVLAVWNADINISETFKPSFYSVFRRTLSSVTETDIKENTYYASYLKTKSAVIPDTQYNSGDTLVYLSPYNLSGFSVTGQAGVQSPFNITSDFIGPRQITFNGETYWYIMYPNIGAGNFKFTIN